MIAEKSSVEEESIGNDGRLLSVASASVIAIQMLGDEFEEHTKVWSASC